MPRLFLIYGQFCTNHPWEVIIATLTGIYMLTGDHQVTSSPQLKPAVKDCSSCVHEAEHYAADVIIMTIIRCFSVLFSYYQCCNLYRLGSRYILDCFGMLCILATCDMQAAHFIDKVFLLLLIVSAIASIFSIVSSFVFTTTVLGALRLDIADLKNAFFFFLLLIDLSKIGALAQYAIKGPKQDIRNNISQGISALGPSVTLNTIVEILVIGIGTLSGVNRLEMFSYVACLSVMVNYVVFMTIYPASLALILELVDNESRDGPADDNEKVLNVLGLPEKRNPIVEKVKIIMSVGLVLVHTHSKILYEEKEKDLNTIGTLELPQQTFDTNATDTNDHNTLMRWFVYTSDQIVILIILLSLIAKFVLIENNTVSTTTQNESCSTNQNKDASDDKVPQIKFFLYNEDDERSMQDKSIQTDKSTLTIKDINEEPVRSLDECVRLYRSQSGGSMLNDEEVSMLVQKKYIPEYQIEQAVDNPDRGVKIRRRVFTKTGRLLSGLENLPFEHYDYSKVMGACCENVIGYVPIPVGIVGPLMLDKRTIYVPLATTEGCLVASTNRGSRALSKLGIISCIVGDGMTRGPVVRFSSIVESSRCMEWIQTPENFILIKNGFDSSSRFARLSKVQPRVAGRYLFIRFVATTGDAMGMNMLSKGTEISLKIMQKYFPQMEILSLSGNYCVDKKPAAINWIEGRGKSVVCEAIVPAAIISSILKTSVHSLVDVNISKNFIGSAMAGSIGGNNAHAANLVTAIFLATGQDPAQNVGSSNCMTIMEPWGDHGEDLYISCSMPSIEVGTIGGGTILPAQGACLEMLGVQGSNEQCPGENANQLARVICATVLAGELSLMAALAAGHLVKSHLRHNRSSTNMCNSINKPNRILLK